LFLEEKIDQKRRRQRYTDADTDSRSDSNAYLGSPEKRPDEDTNNNACAD